MFLGNSHKGLLTIYHNVKDGKNHDGNSNKQGHVLCKTHYVISYNIITGFLRKAMNVKNLDFPSMVL